MTAAVRAAEEGAAVTLYERNPKPGRKLAITGKGRCNLTNNCSPSEFLNNVVCGKKFLYSAAFRFKPEDTIAFFEELGVRLKTERGNRVFPESDRSYDIIDAFVRRIGRLNIDMLTGCRIDGITACEDGGFIVESGNLKSHHPAVIICTGGVSYPLTGSTGDGYKMARSFGISVCDPKPSLVPIETVEDVSPLAGLTLKNVTLTVSSGGKTVFSQMGEMLFAHFGVTGPLVLSASANMRGLPVREYQMAVDFKPAVEKKELDARLEKMFRENSAKDFINAVSRLLPAKLLPYIVKYAGIPERKKTAEISREERRRLCEALKGFRLTPSSFRPVDEAIVTAGGVETSEIDPRTMQSKKIPGLYFAGEVLNADAYTGGFNLQIAFSTGTCAGNAAAQQVNSNVR